MAQGKHVASSEKKIKIKWGLNTVLWVLIGILAVIAITIPAVLLFARSKINRMNYVPTEVDEKTGKPVIEIRDDVPPESEETLVITEVEGEDTEGTLSEEDVELPEGDIVSDKNILNIMLVGTDFKSKTWDDPGRADVTILCSINKKEGTVKLISFERGIMVPIPGKGSDLLTHSYVWGGMNLLLQDLQDCFLLDIDGYMHVDFDSFKDVVDALGGVDIELSAAEAWYLNSMEEWYGDVTMTCEEGMNHLDSTTALHYCRTREIDDNFGRNERQRKMIQAVLSQFKNTPVLELNAVADKVLPLIETNIETDVFMDLVKSAPKFLKLSAEQYQVPEDHNSAGISFSYEADRIKTLIYGE